MPGMSGWVDLRSDTVTSPTPAMRRAMADAEVGDDGYGEDPTVRRLEEELAARVGKAAGLLVPSGTMGNQVAMRLQARPGSVAVAGRRQHVVLNERGATARNGGVQLVTVDDEGGVDPADVGAALEEAAFFHLHPALVCIEDTHMFAGGRPWELDDVAAVAAFGVPVHVDGARLFNAEVATGVPAAAVAAHASTVSCCLSKGLGAPVGSVLAGDADVMAEARDERRRLGGGMRQAGVFAAAGLVALRTMVDRLADDHARARRLAEAVAERWPEAGLDPAAVRTNVVVWRHPDPAAVVDHLEGEGIRARTVAPGTLRFVTHHEVDDEGVDRAVKALASAP